QMPGDGYRCGQERPFSGAELVFREPAGVLELAVTGGWHGVGVAHRAEAQHQAGREGPRLAVAIAHIAYDETGLLADLADDRLLRALTRLDEAGERRVATRRPDRLASKHAAVCAVGDEHDDRG